MKIDERLHDAMHDYADAIEPEPGSWSKIAARFDDEPLSPVRPSRRPLVLAGVACAVAIVLVVSLLIVDTDDGARVTTAPADAMPSRILAINPNGQPVVLDATSGEEQAELGSTIAEGTQIAVSPDGEDAYMVTGDGNEGCASHSVQRLLVGTGRTSGFRAPEATSPTMSPDGRYLAYLRCLPGDARPDEIVLRDLTTGTERTTPAPVGTFFANRLEFAADSRHVVFDLFDDATGRATFHEIDLVGREAPPGRGLPVDPGTSFVFGRLGATGALLAQEAQRSPAHAVALRPGSDPASRTLFTIPEPAEVLASDESGRHILAVVDRTLYRWSEGDTGLTKVADGVTNAAWIPDAASNQPGPAPVGVLIAKRDGELVVLGAQDGQQHRSLGTFPGIAGVATAADGREVFFASTGKSGACGDAPYFDVTKLVPATGETTRVAGGSGASAVSPDGQYVAVGVSCAGPSLGFTSLETGANFGADALGSVTTERSPGIRVVDPLGWSPDSTRLVYRVNLEADDVPRYYVGRLWPVVRQARTEVIELPHGSGISAATFVGDDQVAMAEPRDATTEVRRWTVSTGSREIASPMLFEVPGLVTALVADPSGQHLLAVTEDHSLYRWSQGDARPTKLAEDVTAASWIPWS